MKVISPFVLGAGLWVLASCGKDDNNDPVIEINLISSSCELVQTFTTCLDSNLFVVTFSADLSGPEGTFVGVFANGETTKETIVDCGNWTNKNFPGLPGCSREAGDAEVGNFNLTGELPCISSTESYGSTHFTLAGFVPGEEIISLPSSKASADVFVNCGF